MKPPALLAAILALTPCACAHPASGPAPAASVVPSDLNAKIELRLTGIDVRHGKLGHAMPMDSPGNDIDTFDFVATNRGTKIVSAFDADVVLTNDTGKVLYTDRLAETTVVEAGSSFAIGNTVINAPRSLPNPELVRGASPAHTNLNYRVLDITYADGSKETAQS